MPRLWLCLLLAMMVLWLTGCAAGPNTLAKTPDESGRIAGFWLGLWQGIISPVTFIISLFNSKVNFYEIHNNGGWYNFGFLLGVAMVFGGGCGSTRSCRRQAGTEAQVCACGETDHA